MKEISMALTGMMAAGLFALAEGQPEMRSAKITVQADKPGVKVSPSLWGIFYEEINHAGDGGIYAELVQ
ncbi:MAG: hypothetical protein WCK89_15955, partial [bacterium]